MKIVLGCDVDPELPRYLRMRPSQNVWECLRNLDRLSNLLGEDLPVVTWVIRADESVLFSTGAFDSGYRERAAFWDSLRDRGHELGWHMHLASYKRDMECFGFDAEPGWLDDAHGALAANFPILSTRTGWDYANTALINDLDRLGVEVDFSALPGNVAWFRVGPDRLRADWLRAPRYPYHPSASDYQREGGLKLLEVPITQFSRSGFKVVRRAIWRATNGIFSVRGLTSATRKLTDHWDSVPTSAGGILSFYFHPGDLNAPSDYDNFLRNVESLRAIPGAEFVTASSLALGTRA